MASFLDLPYPRQRLVDSSCLSFIIADNVIDNKDVINRMLKLATCLCRSLSRYEVKDHLVSTASACLHAPTARSDCFLVSVNRAPGEAIVARCRLSRRKSGLPPTDTDLG